MPIRMSGIASGLDTEAMVKELMSAQKMKLTKIDNKKIKNEWKQEKWKELNSKIYSFYTDTLSKMRFQSTYTAKKVVSGNDSKVSATGGNQASNGTHNIQIKQLASSQYITGASLKGDAMHDDVKSDTKMSSLGYVEGNSVTVNFTATGESKTVNITADMTVSEFAAKLKETGINANFDNGQSRFFISSKDSGLDNAFTLSTTSAAGLDALGLGESATVVDAANSIYKYNGAEFEDSTNNISVNGLKITLKGVTADYGKETAETIGLSVESDTEGIFNTVKEFVKGYNDLIDELNKALNADSARGYEPLTDEEKEAMTDDQVKKWEDKIKDSLLRRDSTLSTLISSMRNALAASVDLGDGTKVSLSQFGITTSMVYTENGKLHIAGDSDDAMYASEKDKLMAAFAADPQKAAESVTKIFGNLYSTMSDKMKASSISSALTFYNDKELNKLQSQYEKQYSDMEDKLSVIEERYYKQFSQMEKAMSELQSKQQQLAGLFGTN